MTCIKRFVTSVVLVSYGVIWAGSSLAICSESDHTALFLVTSIYPLDNPQIYRLQVAPVGPETHPTEQDMLDAIHLVLPEESGFFLDAQAGPYRLFFSYPDDFGACAIVDARDNRVHFVGTVVHLGEGSVVWPVISSHDWTFPAGEPAPPPTAVNYLPTEGWNPTYGTQEAITEAVVTSLRGTDVLRSFATCGTYNVTSHIYTGTALPLVVPSTWSMVVIVDGRCGPPWSDVALAAPYEAGAMAIMAIPNPLNPTTTIRYHVAHSGPVRLSIYDATGRRVADLVNAFQPAGAHSVRWNGDDDAGRGLPSGIYFCRLKTGSEETTLKLSLLQ